MWPEHMHVLIHTHIPSTLEGRVRPCSCVRPETATSHDHIRCKNMHQHRDKIPTYNISIGNFASTNMCVVRASRWSVNIEYLHSFEEDGANFFTDWLKEEASVVSPFVSSSGTVHTGLVATSTMRRQHQWRENGQRDCDFNPWSRGL